LISSAKKRKEKKSERNVSLPPGLHLPQRPKFYFSLFNVSLSLPCVCSFSFRLHLQHTQMLSLRYASWLSITACEFFFSLLSSKSLSRKERKGEKRTRMQKGKLGRQLGKCFGVANEGAPALPSSSFRFFSASFQVSLLPPLQKNSRDCATSVLLQENEMALLATTGAIVRLSVGGGGMG
jgi:hypothetical protein